MRWPTDPKAPVPGGSGEVAGLSERVLAVLDAHPDCSFTEVAGERLTWTFECGLRVSGHSALTARRMHLKAALTAALAATPATEPASHSATSEGSAQ